MDDSFDLDNTQINRNLSRHEKSISRPRNLEATLKRIDELEEQVKLDRRLIEEFRKDNKIEREAHEKQISTFGLHVMSVILSHKSIQEENLRIKQRLKELEKENSILRSIKTENIESDQLIDDRHNFEHFYRCNSLLSINSSDDCCGDALASPLAQSLECFESSEEDGWANGGEAQCSPILSMFSSSSKESSSSIGTKSTGISLNRHDDGYGSLLADIRRTNSDPLVAMTINASTPKPTASLPINGVGKRPPRKKGKDNEETLTNFRVFDITKQQCTTADELSSPNNGSNSTNSSLSFSPDQQKSQCTTTTITTISTTKTRERRFSCSSDSSFDSPPRRFCEPTTSSTVAAATTTNGLSLTSGKFSQNGHDSSSTDDDDSLLERNSTKNSLPINNNTRPKTQQAVKRMLTITRSIGAKFKSKNKRAPSKLS